MPSTVGGPTQLTSHRLAIFTKAVAWNHGPPTLHSFRHFMSMNEQSGPHMFFGSPDSNRHPQWFSPAPKEPAIFKRARTSISDSFNSSTPPRNTWANCRIREKSSVYDVRTKAYLNLVPLIWSEKCMTMRLREPCLEDSIGTSTHFQAILKKYLDDDEDNNYESDNEDHDGCKCCISAYYLVYK